MRNFLNLLVPVIALAACGVARAQAPTYKNVGRNPSAEEIRAWDISIGPAGKELPPGSGTAQEGAKIFLQRCAQCHGATGAAIPFRPSMIPRNPLVGKGPLNFLSPVKTIGNFWPFATTIWDYINRAMPQYEEGTLRPEEVYALTAFLLYQNDIIQESDVMDAKTLPKIQMPNRNGFIPLWPEWKAPSGDRSRTP